MSQQQPCRECGNTDYHQRDCSLSEWEDTSNDTAVRDRDRVSRPTPEYTQEEEREAERLAIAAGLGVSAWRDFLSMARTNILRDRSVEQPTPEAKVSVSPATKHDPHCDCGICAYCNGQEDVYGNPSVSPAIEEAIARPPFKIQGRTRSTTLENIPVIARDGEAPEAYAPGDADFVLNAMNAFDSHKAEIERLNSLHDTLCSVLCRETETQTPIAAITAIRAHKAKVERLEASLSHILPRFDITADGQCKFCGRDYCKNIPKDYLCINVDCDAFIARAALIEPPEKENGTI